MTIENRKSPLPALPWHLARRACKWASKPNKTISSHTLADREHIAARQGEAKLQLPKVRRPRGRASANTARADVISARFFAQSAATNNCTRAVYTPDLHRVMERSKIC